MGLFRWFRRKFLTVPDPDQPQLVLTGLGLDEAIAVIAAESWRVNVNHEARQFPQLFGPEVIPEVWRRFADIGEPLPSFEARKRGMTEWIECWWRALDAILFSYRGHVVPSLWEHVREGHNYRALVLLCGLAAEGVEREPILAGLRDLIPELGAEGCEYVVENCAHSARRAPELARVLADLRQVPEFERAAVEVLCRQVSEGPNDTELVAALKNLIPTLSRPAQQLAADRLQSLARYDPALAAIVEDLRQVPAFEQALAEVRH